MLIYAGLTSIETHGDVLAVEGIAPSQGHAEAALADAVRAALPDFAEGNPVTWLGEMSRIAKAGTVDGVTVAKDGSLYLGVTVVDEVAIRKVRMGVYKGLAIAVRVLARDPENPEVVTRVALQNISLVDSPEDPTAMLALWKAQPTGLGKVAATAADLSHIEAQVTSIATRLDRLASIAARVDRLATTRR